LYIKKDKRKEIDYNYKTKILQAYQHWGNISNTKISKKFKTKKSALKFAKFLMKIN